MVYVGVDGQISMRYVAFILILGGSFVCLPLPCSAGGVAVTNCSKDGNYSSTKTYQYNLDILLGKMITESSKTYFSEKSEGLGGDTVYASYICIGDVAYPNQICSKCVQSAVEVFRTKCPTQLKASAWYDECLFQFSNELFFGTWQTDYVTWCGFGQYSNQLQFDKVLTDLISLNESTWRGYEIYIKPQVLFDKVLTDSLNEAANKAAADQTPNRKLGTMDVNLSFVNGSPTLYILAQCVPDLSPRICLQCLNSSISGYLPHWCKYQKQQGWTQYGRTISSSCLVLYNMNQFYDDQSTSATAPALPPLALAVAPSYHAKGKRVLSRILLTVGIPTSVGMFLALGIWYYLMINNKDPDVFEGIDMGEITTADSLQMDFNKVRAATQNFAPDMKLGEGGFGDVFKGKLESGQEIAVKRLTTSNSGQGAAEFKNEVVLVAKLQHLNLVKLLGFCLTAKEKILVYEYLPNSSLDKLIFDPIRRASLDWEKRYNIITGIAKGLLYLLEDSRLRIIHRDLKSSNILLDEAMNPKISDFGIAKTLALDQTRASTEILAGTYGYMAPEYVLTGQYSLKSDIYSFGIIVLEIVTGQRNRFGRPLHEEALLHRAWRLWNENAELEMVDVELNDAYSAEEVVKCIHIGLLCIQEDAAKRPKMASVVAALGGKSIDLPAPTPPNFFNTSHSESTTSASISVTPSTPATCSTQSTLIPR